MSEDSADVQQITRAYQKIVDDANAGKLLQMRPGSIFGMPELPVRCTTRMFSSSMSSAERRGKREAMMALEPGKESMTLEELLMVSAKRSVTNFGVEGMPSSELD